MKILSLKKPAMVSPECAFIRNWGIDSNTIRFLKQPVPHSSFIIRHSSFRAPRGTAFIAVIIMMVLIAAAIAAMGALFATEAKRTQSAIAGAQLRQLLLAADPAAREELARNPTPHELTLPTPIGSLKLHIESASSNSATIRTTAHLADSTAISTTTYTRPPALGGGWTLQSATLSGM